MVGSPVDLSNYENSAEYAIAIKVISRKVPQKVFFKVNCGKDCSGQVDISDSLKKAPRNKWFVLPVPLNCLSMKGVDLSKIDWPFSLATADSLEIHLAEARIAPLAKGTQGCVDDTATAS
nr:putative glycoside hydrolase [Algibacillus agarilyticus]